MPRSRPEANYISSNITYTYIFTTFPVGSPTVRHAGIACHPPRTWTFQTRLTILGFRPKDPLDQFASHAPTPSSFSTSPGFACRPSLDFSKTGVPSRNTSKRPPRDGMSLTSSVGNAVRISAAKLAARGS